MSCCYSYQQCNKFVKYVKVINCFLYTIIIIITLLDKWNAIKIHQNLMESYRKLSINLKKISIDERNEDKTQVLIVMS